MTFDCHLEYPSGFVLDATFETHHRVTAICGPSGSGKTTLLSLIAGLLSPRRGRITLRSKIMIDTAAGIDLRPERRGVGYVFQDYCLFPHLNVRSNIQYGWRRRNGRADTLARLIEVLELDPLLHRYPNSLSGGQQQRVALARALAASPAVLLLDEPLTSVEEEFRERIADLIQRVIDESQIPTLLVSHNSKLVDRLAQRIITIENGKID